MDMENEQVQLGKAVKQFTHDKIGEVSIENVDMISKELITQLRDTDSSVPFLGIKSLVKYEELPNSAFFSTDLFGDNDEYTKSVDGGKTFIEHHSLKTIGFIFLSYSPDGFYKIFRLFDVAGLPTRTIYNGGSIREDGNVIDTQVVPGQQFSDLCQMTANDIENGKNRVCIFKLLIHTQVQTTITPYLKFFKKKENKIVDRYAYVQTITINEFGTGDKYDEKCDIEDRVARLESIVDKMPVMDGAEFAPTFFNGPMGHPPEIIIAGEGEMPPELAEMFAGMGINRGNLPTSKKKKPKVEIKSLIADKRDEIKEFIVDKEEYLKECGIDEETYTESIQEIFHLINNDVIANNIKEVGVYFGNIKDSKLLGLVDMKGEYYSRFVSHVKHTIDGENIPVQVKRAYEYPDYSSNLITKWHIQKNSIISAVVLERMQYIKDPNKFAYGLFWNVFGPEVEQTKIIKQLDLIN